MPADTAHGTYTSMREAETETLRRVVASQSLFILALLSALARPQDAGSTTARRSNLRSIGGRGAR